MGLIHYVVSIDSIEKVTGIDFFPILQDEMEDKLESKISVSGWFVSKMRSSASKEEMKSRNQEAVGGYWITKSSKKRHKPSCRYFKKTKGRMGGKSEGKACGVCGG